MHYCIPSVGSSFVVYARVTIIIRANIANRVGTLRLNTAIAATIADMAVIGISHIMAYSYNESREL
jgi:hypothetical protein